MAKDSRKLRYSRIISLLEFYQNDLREKFGIPNKADKTEMKMITDILTMQGHKRYPKIWYATIDGYVYSVLNLLRFYSPEKIDEMIAEYYHNLQIEIEHEEKMKLIP
jgi:hypothetical protein